VTVSEKAKAYDAMFEATRQNLSMMEYIVSRLDVYPEENIEALEILRLLVDKAQTEMYDIAGLGD